MTPRVAALGTAILGLLLIGAFLFWDTLVGNDEVRWGYFQTVGVSFGLAIMLIGLVAHQDIKINKR
jgi:hypothetical protein